MHSVGDLGGPGVPAFLTKLWTLVEDPSTDELICWDPSGRSFHVYEQSRFAKEVLPMYFKHSNIASFIRQLNMYGFRKVVNVEAGGLKTERDDMEFAHQYFVRDQENLLEYIKRKVPNSKAEEVKLKPGDLTHVLGDVHDLKDKQENMTSKLGALKVENEALWREVANLRQKHHKQQQIVNKLIQFLVSLVGNRGIPTRKRNLPLMINDAPSSKVPKLTRQHSQHSIENAPKPSTGDLNQLAKSGGLTIHDITDLPDVSGVAADKSQLFVQQEQPISVADLVHGVSQPQQDPMQQISLSDTPVDINSLIDVGQHQAIGNIDVDLSALTGDSGASIGPSTSMTSNSSAPTTSTQPSVAVAVPTSSINSSRAALKVDVNLRPTSPAIVPLSPSRLEIGDHVDNLQADLEAIKDLLSTGQYNLDSTQLLELFNVEPPTSLPADIFSDPTQDASAMDNPLGGGPSGMISGNELIQYTAPNEMGPIFDLSDELASSSNALDLTTANQLLDIEDKKDALTEEVD